MVGGRGGHSAHPTAPMWVAMPWGRVGIPAPGNYGGAPTGEEWGGGHRLSGRPPPPATPTPATRTPPLRPRTGDRHHLAEFNWGHPSYKSHPTTHSTHTPHPPPQNNTQKGWRGDWGPPTAPRPPPPPQQHKGTAKAHSKALALLLRQARRGWWKGGTWPGGGQSRGLGAPAKTLKGKAPESPLGKEKTPSTLPAPPHPASPKAVGRQWGGGGGYEGGAQGGEGDCWVLSNWGQTGPRSSRPAEGAQGEGVGGCTLPPWGPGRWGGLCISASRPGLHAWKWGGGGGGRQGGHPLPFHR